LPVVGASCQLALRSSFLIGIVNRWHQCILIGSLLPLSWLGMMVVHEFGHVLGALVSGGTVCKVVLHPFTISRTELSHNPHPLAVVWAGPLVGVLLPLAALGLARVMTMPGRYLLRFFAGFCLIANGVYIGVGSFDGVGDCGEMLRQGSAPWHLWAFGALTAPVGLWLWHGQGPHFGLGKTPGLVHPTAAYVCLALLVAVVMVEIMIGGE
jgi:hypothetical protein